MSYDSSVLTVPTYIVVWDYKCILVSFSHLWAIFPLLSGYNSQEKETATFVILNEKFTKFSFGELHKPFLRLWKRPWKHVLMLLQFCKISKVSYFYSNWLRLMSLSTTTFPHQTTPSVRGYWCDCKHIWDLLWAKRTSNTFSLGLGRYVHVDCSCFQVVNSLSTVLM